MKESKFTPGQLVNFWRGEHRKPLMGIVVKGGNVNIRVHFPSINKLFVLSGRELEIIGKV